MKTINIVVAVIALLLLGNWYYSSYMQKEAVQINEQDTGDTTQTYTDPKSGITFTAAPFPDYRYVSASEWPPRFVNSVDPIKCELDEQTQAMSGATSSTKTINGNTYCIWETNEGAAGSVYRTYQLTYPKENQYFTMSFTLQYPQCMNYPTDEVKVCELEQEGFPINNFTDSIAQSARLPD